MKYQILEHPADLKVKVFGKNQKELFSNCLFAMSECLEPKVQKKLNSKVSRDIEINSLDSLTLLVDFLSEALYLSQTHKEVYLKAKFSFFSKAELKGKLIGRKAEVFGEEIKGVTYHSLDIARKKGRWEAILVFDI
jgi:SHS2 domain-containing protein